MSSDFLSATAYLFCGRKFRRMVPLKRLWRRRRMQRCKAGFSACENGSKESYITATTSYSVQPSVIGIRFPSTAVPFTVREEIPFSL